MIEPEPISFTNTGLPLVILGALAIVVPYLLVPAGTRKQWEVAVAIWASAGILLLAGAGVFAVIYALQGRPVGAAFSEAPLTALWFFLKVSGYGAVAWAPVMALTWLALAQRVEKRKGEDMSRGGR